MKMSDDERRELLGLYEGLRVADVRDGMDRMRMHGVGSVSPSIRPLYRTRIAGIARTARSNVIPSFSLTATWTAPLR